MSKGKSGGPGSGKKGGSASGPTGGHSFFADPDSSFQEGTGAQHYGAAIDAVTEIQFHTCYFAIFNDQTFGHALTQSQIRQ